MRRIFHIDMNSFFASCEEANNPELAGKKIAVAGDPAHRSGIILAASYPAKAMGVKTTMPIFKALQACPDLIVLEPHFELYHEKSEEFMNILSEYAPVIEQASIDEAYIDLTGTEHMYPDYVKLAEEIQNRILNETGLKCSIGISENKLLAKMGSDYKKPLGITEIYIEDVEEKLWPLPVGDLFGVGKKTEEYLSQIGVFTIGDLAKFDLETLKKHFGDKGATWLRNSANGLEFSPVLPNDAYETKSNGAEHTFDHDTDDLEEIKGAMFWETERIASSLRDLHVKSKTVCLKIKFEDFTNITRNLTIHKPIQLQKDIYEYACKILEDNYDKSKKIRLIGVSCTNFEDEDEEVSQLSLFDDEDEETEEVNEKIDKIEHVSDLLKDKFGDTILVKGNILKNKGKYDE